MTNETARTSLKKLSVWVNWKYEKDPNGKPTKVPYQANPSGLLAKTTDPDTWTTYEMAKLSMQHFDGIGLVFDGTVLGVDLDHVIKDGRIIDEGARKFVEVADTFTELSPSKTGLHLYFRLTDEPTLTSHTFKPNPNVKYEAYTRARYFTFTEDHFGKKKPMRLISGDEAIKLLGALGYPWKKEKDGGEKMPATAGNNLTKEDVLRIMTRAKNGEKARALLSADASLYEGDESSSDMALCSLLAFYTGKNAALIEEIWLESERGKREKVQKRADYRKRTIDAAIEHTKEVFTPTLATNKAMGKEPKYVTKKLKDGGEVIVLCTQNIQIFLETHPEFENHFRYDTFKQKTEYLRDNEWVNLSDADVIAIQCRVSELHPSFTGVSKQMTHDAVIHNARLHTYDSVKDYFTSLVWDKVPRIDTWMCHVYGVEDNAYHRAVGANWLKGLAKRAVEPGSKFDCVLVIEGDQGIRKSMSFEALGGEWYASTLLTPDTKDFFMLFIGRLIVEFSEGETLSRSDMKKLKAAITTLADDFRMPYAREVERFPRRCVFSMTTNEGEYLKDETGNRRWLPVTAVRPEVNVEWIHANRDQLFAEAYYRAVTRGEKYWEFPKEEVEKEQRSRQFFDPMADIITEWYVSLPPQIQQAGITIRQAYIALYPEANTVFARQKLGKLEAMQIGSALRSTLYLKKREVRMNGIRTFMYFPTEKTPKSQALITEDIGATF